MSDGERGEECPTRSAQPLRLTKLPLPPVPACDRLWGRDKCSGRCMSFSQDWCRHPLSAFPQTTQLTSGTRWTHHNLSLMNAIINVNGEDTSDQDQL